MAYSLKLKANKIYMDYAATSPVKPEVLKAMMPYFCDKFGNASSIHSFGREARSAVENARKIVAGFLGCLPDEIIFTSGGTESDNLAIKGLITAISYKAVSRKGKPHIITSAFEHHAVLDTCKDLEKRGLAEITYIKPDKEGIIHPESVKKAIKSNTVLVSIMYVNNEIGTVQLISEIAKAISESRKPYAVSHKIYFHTDAVQAVEYQPMTVKKLSVDMMSISAHKFGGPKGVGILYLKKGTPMHRENIGGAQEFNLRAGTENVAGIVGMGKALQVLSSKYKVLSIKKTTRLRNYFIERILKEIPDTSLNGSKKFRSPNNINISFKYIEGEAILIHLDLAGIAASSGSACTSGSLDPSHVLLSLGMKHEDAHGSIRFTLGEMTTKKEIDYTISELKKIVKKLRDISPFAK